MLQFKLEFGGVADQRRLWSLRGCAVAAVRRRWPHRLVHGRLLGCHDVLSSPSLPFSFFLPSAVLVEAKKGDTECRPSFVAVMLTHRITPACLTPHKALS
jgi:hypothetical protein